MNYDEIIRDLEELKKQLLDEASRLRVVSIQIEIDKRAAFRAGAEAMREAILNHMSYYGSTDVTIRRDNQIANAIRALPLPEMTTE